MLTGGEDGGYSSWVAGFLHTGHAEYIYGQQKGSNHIHKKAAGAISVCLTPPPPLLDLTPLGFTLSIGATTRAAGSLHRPCFQPPRLQRPFPNCFYLGFGPLSLEKQLAAALEELVFTGSASVPSASGGFAPGFFTCSSLGL